MLSFMRKYAQSWFVTLIIGAIVVVFVLWGIGTFRSAHFQKVAVVNGVKIVLPEYLRAYQNLMRMYQERLGADFNEEALKALNLPAQTINQLIDELLIQQAGQRFGLVVTDAELRQYIQKNPAFADERGFNEKRYYQLLARQRLPASDYEARERQRLLTQKIIAFITAFAKVSEADLQETHRLESEAVRVEYLVLSPASFLKNQQVTPEEAEAFYNSHKERFREPAKFRARYVLLKFSNFEAQLKPDPKKVEAFFYDHLDDFSQPQAIRVQEIRLEIPSQISAGDRQRLQQQVQALVQAIPAGLPLNQVAKKFSQVPGVKLHTQDLGVVKRQEKPAQWEAVAFGLGKGGIGLATLPGALHIIQVMEIVEKRPPAFAAVQSQVEKVWRQAEAMQLAQQQAATLRSEMLNSSFEAIANQQRLPVQETPLLSAQEAFPELGAQPALSQAAFKLRPQELSKPITLNQGVVLLQVLERRDSFLPPLAEIKNQVAEAVRLEKAKAAAAQEAKKLLARLQQGEPLAKLAKQLGVPLRDSGWFTRPQGFPGQPQARSLATAAFTLSAAHPFPTEPISLNGENFLLAFKERRSPTPEQFAQEREQLLKALLEVKQQMVFSQWLAEERQRAKIQVYELPS